jgi:hypothetical protein
MSSAIKQSALHCVTCWQSLPEGQEPEYFGQGSVDYKPERETERAAEDVYTSLKYASSINSALWDMLQVAELASPKLPDPEHYLDEASDLAFLLIDLMSEATRRVHKLRELVAAQIRAEEVKADEERCARLAALDAAKQREG